MEKNYLSDYIPLGLPQEEMTGSYLSHRSSILRLAPTASRWFFPRGILNEQNAHWTKALSGI